jgi:hypothetical protein
VLLLRYTFVLPAAALACAVVLISTLALPAAAAPEVTDPAVEPVTLLVDIAPGATSRGSTGRRPCGWTYPPPTPRLPAPCWTPRPR